MTKKEARQQVKEWMKKLDKNYIEKADQSIFEQVKELKEFQDMLNDPLKLKEYLEREKDSKGGLVGRGQGKTIKIKTWNLIIKNTFPKISLANHAPGFIKVTAHLPMQKKMR